MMRRTYLKTERTTLKAMVRANILYSISGAPGTKVFTTNCGACLIPDWQKNFTQVIVIKVHAFLQLKSYAFVGGLKALGQFETLIDQPRFEKSPGNVEVLNDSKTNGNSKTPDQ